jgi:hypothetical protein
MEVFRVGVGRIRVRGTKPEGSPGSRPTIFDLAECLWSQYEELIPQRVRLISKGHREEGERGPRSQREMAHRELGRGWGRGGVRRG